MCGRFEQSRTRRYYAGALGADISDHQKWSGADSIGQYNVAPGLCVRMFTLYNGKLTDKTQRWGYRTPEEAAEKKKPWINARIEKALTGRYFRHMFREGRVLIPTEGWYETV